MASGKNFVAWIGSEIIRLIAWAICTILALIIVIYVGTLLKIEGLSLLVIMLMFTYPIYRFIRVLVDRFIEQVLLKK